MKALLIIINIIIINILSLLFFIHFCRETFTTLENIYENNLEINLNNVNKYIYDRKNLETTDPILFKDEQDAINMEKEEYLKRKSMYASNTCPATVSTDSKVSCLHVHGIYEYNNGNYSVKNYTKLNDFVLIGLLAWNTYEFIWTGFLTIHYMSGSQNIVVTPTFADQNLEISVQNEYLKFTNMKMLNATGSFFYKTSTILSKNDLVYQLQQGANRIPLNTGKMLFNRNVVNNNDLMILIMTVRTQNNGKFWTGLVTINHYTYPGWSDFEKIAGNVNMASTWGPVGDAYLAIADINQSDGELSYSAKALTSKNTIGLTSTVVNNMIYLDDISQGIIALTVWASKAQYLYHVQSRDTRLCYKYWSGFVHIKPFHPTKQRKEIDLKLIGQSFNTMSLSTDVDSNNKPYIQIKNVDSLDGTLSYQTAVVVSRK